MAPEPDLLAAVDHLGATPFNVHVFRHTAPQRDPFSGAGARLLGGRWNKKGGPATVYLAEPVEAAIGEFLRMAEGQGHGTSSFLPRNVHEVALAGHELIDLRSDDALRSVGLTRADIGAEAWEACQEVGAAVELLGYNGVVAPSATGLGDVYSLFETRIDPVKVILVATRNMIDYL